KAGVIAKIGFSWRWPSGSAARRTRPAGGTRRPCSGWRRISAVTPSFGCSVQRLNRWGSGTNGSSTVDLGDNMRSGGHAGPETVLKGRTATEVAKELRLAVGAVHVAKHQLGKMLRDQIAALQDQEHATGGPQP